MYKSLVPSKKTASKAAKTFGLERPGWDFNEDGTATVKLRAIIEPNDPTKKKGTREGSITVQ